MAYETVTPIIPNTTMQKYINGAGTWTAYVIKPESGYVLHDSSYDAVHTDEEGNVTSVELGYRRTEASVAAAYDFTTTQETDINGNTVTAYGERKFYTLLESDVPTANIFGGGTTPEVESMAEGENPVTEIE